MLHLRQARGRGREEAAQVRAVRADLLLLARVPEEGLEAPQGYQLPPHQVMDGPAALGGVDGLGCWRRGELGRNLCLLCPYAGSRAAAALHALLFICHHHLL